MKREIGLWQLGGWTFTAVLGTLLHFLYGWTGSVGVAAFSAVNESTWEHMKLAFFPMLLFALIQARFFVDEYNGFWWVKFFGTLLAVSLIPILYYTYAGAFGKSPDWLNIVFFFVSTGLGYLLEWILLKRGGVACKGEFVAVMFLMVGVAAFVIFTYMPLTLPIFQDPITGGYGILL